LTFEQQQQLQHVTIEPGKHKNKINTKHIMGKCLLVKREIEKLQNEKTTQQIKDISLYL